jgi:hypothetical protein
MSVEDDIAHYEREAAEETLIDNAIKDLSEGPIIDYLATYGYAIENRIKNCHEQAKELLKCNFFGPSLILSNTAIELIVRHLLLRPLILGAFLSEEWASILTNRVLQGRTVDDQKLLSNILNSKWKIDVSKIKLNSGVSFQESLKRTRNKRNQFVHSGEPVEKEDPIAGIEIIDVFFKDIIYPISKRLSFTVEVTGKWCESNIENKYNTFFRKCTPEDPFNKTYANN